jgi:CSLREA domain-containing protein
VGAALLVLGALATPAFAAPFTVDSTADVVDAAPGDGLCATAVAACTLRAAVQETNALAGADQISVPAGTYRLTIAGANEDAAATGDLDVLGALTMIGAGARTVAVSAKVSADANATRTDRVLDVIAGGSLTLSKVAVDGGNGSTGGNIRAAGPLSLTDTAVLDGLASGSGAGIWSSAAVTLERVTVSGNRVPFGDGAGGGIASSASLEIVNSTFAANSSSGNGGGVMVSAGTADIVNATFAQNYANNGPGTAVGGQIYNAGAVQIRNSILERTIPSGPNCGGTALVSGGHNVDDDGSCALAGPGDYTFSFFGWTYFELVNAGGETNVIPPFEWPSSRIGAGPAVDIGGSSCPATDQRGIARPQGASCDAGAYEAMVADLVLTVAGAPAQAAAGGTVAYTLTLANSGSATAARPALSWTGESGEYVVTRDGAICTSFNGCFSALAPGESYTLDVRQRIKDEIGPSTESTSYAIFNDAPVQQATLDPVDANSRATVAIQVMPKPVPVAPPAVTLAPCSVKKTGTNKRDVLRGTAGPDLLRGLGGNDKLSGLAGDDCLDGGAGSDVLDGGAGKDKLTGGAGADSLKGGAGDDVINAADHKRDTIDCGKGRDRATVDRIDRVRNCERVKRKR